jgi:hypothetical protein
MVDRLSFSAIVIDGELIIRASCTSDHWGALHALLIVAGAKRLSLPVVVGDLTSAGFFFPDPTGSGSSVGVFDRFMHRLFVGLMPEKAARS